jgi:hypothetical protein
MSANTNNRVAIKWIRDRAKSAYIKQEVCYICGATEALELHHTHSLTNLFEKWVKDNNLDISTDADVLEIRDDFINQHHGEIYTDVFTLCLKHHQQLHVIYGKAPSLHTAKKQSVWINKQRDKFNGLEYQSSVGKSGGEIKSSTTNNKSGSWLQYRV